MPDLKLFEDKKIRTHWDADKEEWFFSIVDVCDVLAETKNATTYWRKLKQRLISEGNESVTNCHALKMLAKDGKMRLTDVADTKGILRIIQSIPSKKAEPFKLWLAQVGSERLDEIVNPELSIDRAIENYKQKGYSDKWINQRIKSIEVRKELTDEWNRSGVTESREYAILTNEITQAWSGHSVKSYKEIKGLKKENLRDNMTNVELILNMLAEVTTTEISKSENPQGLNQSAQIARRGGKVAHDARKNIEIQTGKPVVTPLNAQNLTAIEDEGEHE